MNLARLGEENFETYGEYVSLVFEGKEYTNRDQHRAATRLANALRVLAFVVAKAGQEANAEEIMAFCQEKLARFKCPKQVRFVESLPKNPIGKILKKELRRLIESNPA